MRKNILRSPIFQLSDFWRVNAKAPEAKLKERLIEGKSFLFSRARDGLTSILNAYGIGASCEVLVPGYICSSVVQAIRLTGATPRFYDIFLDLQPNLESIQKKISERTKAFIFVHYFGFHFSDAAAVDFLKSRNILILEDCAHTLFSSEFTWMPPFESDARFISFTKFYAVPDGAWVDFKAPKAGLIKGSRKINRRVLIYSGINLFLNWLEFYTGLKLREFFRKGESIRGSVYRWLAATKGDFTEKTRNSTGPNRNYIGPNCLKFSFKVVCASDAQSIAEKRRFNYRSLLVGLSGMKEAEPIFSNLPEDVCPLGLPLLCTDRDQLYEKLLKVNIDARPVWFNLPPEVEPGECPIAEKIAASNIILPVHQDLNQQNLEYIIRCLKSEKS